MRLGAIACTMLSLLAAPGDPLAAQPLRGLGDDALTPRRGVIRVSTSSTIADAADRFAGGTRQPLAQAFSTDALGAGQLPGLAGAQSALRTATGLNTLVLSLGTTSVAAQTRSHTIPLELEAGLTNRLSLSVTVPFVRTLTEVSVGMNPSRSEGNVNVNPTRAASTDDATTARGINTTLVSQITTAQQELNSLIAACTTNSGSSVNCPAALSSGAALASAVGLYADAIARSYGTNTVPGAAFVPVAGTAADSAVRNSLSALRTQLEAVGITAIAASNAGPSRPTTVMTPDGLQRVLIDTTFGIVSNGLRTFARQSIGDVEFALKLRLFDAYGFANDTARFTGHGGIRIRQSVAAAFRLGTGTVPNARDYFDPGTGGGQNDVEVRSFTDILAGRHFFASLVARYAVQMADQQTTRIPASASQPFPELFRERLVDRKLGNVLELELTPRWVLSDFFSVGSQYVVRRRSADRYTGSFTVAPAESGLPDPLTLDASILGSGTAATEHRVGLGVAYSSVAAYQRGRARLPIEVEYLTQRTVAAAGGIVPKVTLHRVQIRVYARMRGR